MFARPAMTARNSLLRQWNELDFVARNLAEMAGRPFGFGLLDSFLARRDEIPPDVPRSIHSGAAHDHQVRIGDGIERKAIARAQHKQALAAKPVAGDVDLAID